MGDRLLKLLKCFLIFIIILPYNHSCEMLNCQNYCTIIDQRYGNNVYTQKRNLSAPCFVFQFIIEKLPIQENICIDCDENESNEFIIAYGPTKREKFSYLSKLKNIREYSSFFKYVLKSRNDEKLYGCINKKCFTINLYGFVQDFKNYTTLSQLVNNEKVTFLDEFVPFIGKQNFMFESIYDIFKKKILQCEIAYKDKLPWAYFCNEIPNSDSSILISTYAGDKQNNTNNSEMSILYALEKNNTLCNSNELWTRTLFEQQFCCVEFPNNSYSCEDKKTLVPSNIPFQGEFFNFSTHDSFLLKNFTNGSFDNFSQSFLFMPQYANSIEYLFPMINLDQKKYGICREIFFQIQTPESMKINLILLSLDTLLWILNTIFLIRAIKKNTNLSYYIHKNRENIDYWSHIVTNYEIQEKTSPTKDKKNGKWYSCLCKQRNSKELNKKLTKEKIEKHIIQSKKNEKFLNHIYYAFSCLLRENTNKWTFQNILSEARTASQITYCMCFATSLFTIAILVPNIFLYSYVIDFCNTTEKFISTFITLFLLFYIYYGAVELYHACKPLKIEHSNLHNEINSLFQLRINQKTVTNILNKEKVNNNISKINDEVLLDYKISTFLCMIHDHYREKNKKEKNMEINLMLEEMEIKRNSITIWSLSIQNEDLLLKNEKVGNIIKTRSNIVEMTESYSFFLLQCEFREKVIEVLNNIAKQHLFFFDEIKEKCLLAEQVNISINNQNNESQGEKVGQNSIILKNDFTLIQNILHGTRHVIENFNLRVIFIGYLLDTITTIWPWASWIAAYVYTTKVNIIE